MFCSKCGNKLNPQSNFCAKCGSETNTQDQFDQAIEQSTYEPVEEAVVNSAEPVVWVFQAQKKLSMLKLIQCSIVFMEDKILLAHLTKDLRKTMQTEALDEVQEQELGFFKKSAEMMRYWSNFSNRYYTMSVEEILAEDPSNTIIYKQNIDKVLFRGYYDDHDDSNSKQGKLDFSLSDGNKIKFTHKQSANKNIKEILTNIFGGKLKYKSW